LTKETETRRRGKQADKKDRKVRDVGGGGGSSGGVVVTQEERE